MKKIITVLLTCLFFFSGSVLLISTGKEKDVPVLKGEYLGQKKPGLTPQLFAPEFISTSKSEFNAAFSPDGKEFYYSVSLPSNRKTWAKR